MAVGNEMDGQQVAAMMQDQAAAAPQAGDPQAAPAIPQANQVPAPGDQVDTVSSPQSTQMLDAQQQAHHGRLASILDSVGSMLGGADQVTVSRDDKGNMVISRAPSTLGQKWGRIAGTALQGMGAGFSVPNGPGNLGRAAAAGVQSGVQGQKDQQQQQITQANQDFDAKQAAQTHKANMALTQARLLESSFDLDRKKGDFLQADANRENDVAAMVAAHPGSQKVATGIKSMDDVHKLPLSDPDILKDHANARLYVTPKFDSSGKFQGHDVYRIDPTWAEQKNDKAVNLHSFAVDPNAPAGSRPVMKATNVPAGGMTNGELMLAQQALDGKNNEVADKWHDNNLQDQKEQSEAVLRRQQGAQATAGASKDYAEAGKARAETMGLQAGAADSQEAMAQQIASGDVKPLNLSRNNPYNKAIMQRVYAINPKYTDSLYTATQDLRSTKPNTMGANVGRLGTAILHGDNALKGSAALGTSPGLFTGVGTPLTSAYNESAEFLTGEVGQYVDGGKLTIKQGEDIKKNFHSPFQSVRDAALHKVIELSGGKLQSQMESFKNATQNEFPTERVFNDPGIRSALGRHGILPPANGAPQAAAPSQGVPAPPQGVPAPSTHSFSLSAWQKANPNGDTNAAKAAAQKQGFTVIQ